MLSPKPSFNTKQIPHSVLHRNLYRVLLIRSIVLGLQFSALALAWSNGLAPQTSTSILVVLIGLSVLSGFSFLRIRMSRPLTELEFMAQLLVDVLGLTLLLYFCGGSTNPFVSYYLIPITIAAAVLPWRYTLLVSIISVMAYSILLFYYHPLDSLAPDHSAHHMGNSSAVNLHVLGMWINFVVSTFLITFFVVKMAQALRTQEQELNLLKEDELRNEQILGIATLAAGTAHELGTPLSTMKVITAELLADAGEEEVKGHKEDLQLLMTQIESCQKKLKELVQTASFENIPAQSVRDYLDKLLQNWMLFRQEVVVEINFQGDCPAVMISPPKTLEQSIVNLLDNAADASPDKLLVTIEWDSNILQMTIRDFGEGIPEELVNDLGQVFVTNKEQGLGIGLLLTHATVNHYGGVVKLFRESPGTLTQLQLPLQGFSVTDEQEV